MLFWCRFLSAFYLEVCTSTLSLGEHLRFWNILFPMKRCEIYLSHLKKRKKTSQQQYQWQWQQKQPTPLSALFMYFEIASIWYSNIRQWQRFIYDFVFSRYRNVRKQNHDLGACLHPDYCCPHLLWEKDLNECHHDLWRFVIINLKHGL